MTCNQVFSLLVSDYYYIIYGHYLVSNIGLKNYAVASSTMNNYFVHAVMYL